MNKSSANQNTFVLTRKSLIVLGVVLLALAGTAAIWYHFTRNPPAWMVRWQVKRYLKRESLVKSFETAFPFPSKEAMSKAPAESEVKKPGQSKGTRTGKDFDALAAEYLKLKEAALILEREIPGSATELTNARSRLDRLTRNLAEAQARGATNLAVQQAQIGALRNRITALESNAAATVELKRRETDLVAITADLWDFQRVWDEELKVAEASGMNQLAQSRDEMLGSQSAKFDKAASYGEIYELIGQQIWVADRLLGSANPGHRRVGLSLALESSRRAMDDAVNGWLGARIIQGFVWPHLDLATDSNRRSTFNLDNLLNQCADAFRRNDEFPSVIRNYEIMLARADSPQRADQARYQIAMAYEQAGELKDALKYLHQIQMTNDFTWALRRIPRIEQQLKAGR